MSFDLLSAALPTPTDADCLDLDTLFAPMQREEIEMIVVKLLHKYPQEAEWIVQTARKPVDTLEISNELASSLNLGVSIPSICSDIEAYITRATDFLRGGHVRNAVAVLETLTPATATWTVEQGAPDEMEAEDKECIEALYAVLENAWQSVIEQCVSVETPSTLPPTGVASKTTLTRTSGAEKQAKQRAGVKLTYAQLGKNEMDYHAAMLLDAKKKLTQTIGPMFSDPLRILNKKRAAPANVTATQSAAAAAASSSSSTAAAAAASSSSSSSTSVATPTAGTKRKKSDEKETDAEEQAEQKEDTAAKAPEKAKATSDAAAADSKVTQPSKKKVKK